MSSVELVELFVKCVSRVGRAKLSFTNHVSCCSPQEILFQKVLSFRTWNINCQPYGWLDGLSLHHMPGHDDRLLHPRPSLIFEFSKSWPHSSFRPCWAATPGEDLDMRWQKASALALQQSRRWVESGHAFQRLIWRSPGSFQFADGAGCEAYLLLLGLHASRSYSHKASQVSLALFQGKQHNLQRCKGQHVARPRQICPPMPWLLLLICCMLPKHTTHIGMGLADVMQLQCLEIRHPPGALAADIRMKAAVHATPLAFFRRAHAPLPQMQTGARFEDKYRPAWRRKADLLMSETGKWVIEENTSWLELEKLTVTYWSVLKYHDIIWSACMNCMIITGYRNNHILNRGNGDVSQFLAASPKERLSQTAVPFMHNPQWLNHRSLLGSHKIHSTAMLSSHEWPSKGSN